MIGLTDDKNYQDIANAIREKNGSQEVYKPNEMANAIKDIEPHLEEKQVTIDNNGETIIVPAEEYEGLSKVVINSRVSGDGYDFTTIGYTKDESDEINSVNTEGIRVAKEIMDNWDNTREDRTTQFAYREDIIHFPNVSFELSKRLLGILRNTNINRFFISDFPNAENCGAMFIRCKRLTGKVVINAPKCTNYNDIFSYCGSLQECELNTDSCKTMINPFYLVGGIKKIQLSSIKNITNSISVPQGEELEILRFTEWKAYNWNVNICSRLSKQSIKYIIWHALNGDNILGFENQGATSRTLTLQKATAHDVTWAGIKDTTPSVADCEMLGIDESEITKYGNLTWSQIASDVKLITITA